MERLHTQSGPVSSVVSYAFFSQQLRTEVVYCTRSCHVHNSQWLDEQVSQQPTSAAQYTALLRAHRRALVDICVLSESSNWLLGNSSIRCMHCLCNVVLIIHLIMMR
jgi:hypothetical protein